MGDATTSRRILSRIASELGISVDELFSPRSGLSSIPSPAEVDVLLRAFAQLRDPQARARVIAAAEAELREM